ncbi:polysaccharide pyruvyl transferase family protein [Desulfuromonas sp. CSMB_57]|jgi:pyruvyl transferase EpsO|uniref:polysaccharide pyruvyl transferase family protein n=1 Tax=Desulfuromonas sp. CSMB_57 TaxID=2807629 RepID=UPI001CD306AE|nr:polysaccharide pyruvyl transferase family protein [Desulfuromonas sp. CSMB_57]
MDNSGRLLNIKNIIKNSLSSVICNDYVFLDLPYYSNIGDSLIWKGTESFLATLPYTCIYRASIETYIPPDIDKDVIILLHGGGNFGDLWRRHTEFVLKIVERFYDNRIVILPQTVHYQDQTVMMEDALKLSMHPRLSICARDSVTKKLLEKYFSNQILLVPDMAFFIFPKKNSVCKNKNFDKTLLLFRRDKELRIFNAFETLRKQNNNDEKDWPGMEKKLFCTKILSRLIKIRNKIKNKVVVLYLSKFIDWYALKIHMPRLYKIGLKFINSYEKIYSTRLHGAIMGILLKKHVVIFDNSYGKNKSFYNTWLNGFESTYLVEK